MKELYTDNQHLKKTIFDLSCLGFQGDGRLESTQQTEVRKTFLLSCANYQKKNNPPNFSRLLLSWGVAMEIPLAVVGLLRVPRACSCSVCRLPHVWVTSAWAQLMCCDAFDSKSGPGTCAADGASGRPCGHRGVWRIARSPR